MDVYSQSDLKGAVVTVFGGTGFIGAHIIARLAAKGARIKVATRHSPSVYSLRPLGEVGQIVPVLCSYGTEEDVSRAVHGSDLVVNCTGILYEKRENQFAHVHADLPFWIAKACSRHNIQRFVHISALAVDRAQSEYAISKMSGERGIMQAFPEATILRPSVVFGAEDQFFNKFASLARLFPLLPLFGGGESKFQPVYVEDVAEAVVVALTRAETAGKIYELGGPDVMSLKEIYKKIALFTGINIRKVCIPWWLARIQAFFFGLLPKPLLTNDQVTSLQTDNVVCGGALSFSDLGIVPKSVDEIVPTYLGRHLYKA